MTMSTARHTVRDLIEEAKKRVILFLICLFGLSYLMSLTSSSVWVNLPAAAVLIVFFRYISLDLDIHKKSKAGSNQPLLDPSSKIKSIKPHDFPLEKINWRSKVNSPPTEEAIDHFTRHLVSEWVTDLWYSRITPDKDGPEELVQIINNVFGEISSRARDVNLIELLTRDIINLFCNHLEIYRTSVSKIGRQELKKLTPDHQDIQLKHVLAAESKLHPALFSPKAEHKVLQHLVNGLMLTTFRPKDLECYFFQYTTRELLACAVFRPVLNLANPRFINEKIESLVLSLANKADKDSNTSTDLTANVKSNASSKPSVEQLSGLQDRSAVGLELVQFKPGPSKIASNEQADGATGLKHQHSSGRSSVGTHETPLMPGAINDGAQALPDTQTNHVDPTVSSISKGEWGHILDIISQKKRQALAPEHLENIWAKGRNYRKKEGSKQPPKQNTSGTSICNNSTKKSAATSGYLKKDKAASFDASLIDAHSDMFGSALHLSNPYQEMPDVHEGELEIVSESSYETEDEESSNVTGLDSPGTRVWDSKNKRNASVSHIRHPLENPDFHSTKIKVKSHVRHPRTLRTPSGRKRIRPGNQKTPLWQEIERSSFLLGERHDILNELNKDDRVEELSDEPDVEIVGRIHSGAAASSSPRPSISASESSTLSLKSAENSVLADSFLKLRCEVFGANIVKSGSVTFAVYSIAVTDANNHCWSIKRRFRHFEELHRRLKEFPEYNLSLPPKHFLSSGLDMPVVQERCKSLDKYLKRLLELPNISGSIEVWDFLSVDSQTYIFSNSLSIMQTLSADLDYKPPEKSAKLHNSTEVANSQLPSRTEQLSSVNGTNALYKKHTESENVGMRKRKIQEHIGVNVGNEGNILSHGNSGGDTDNMAQRISCRSKIENDEHKSTSGGNSDLPQASQIPEAFGDLTLPTEWTTPNLSVPILDLIDVIFQLKDGGWIRRKAFWVAKQLLQLGMGDAFDDWLIDKIQQLRKGSVVANAIRRIEQILWPDGIFITKHPNRKPPTPVSSPGNISSRHNSPVSDQQLEDARRAKFVYELIIDKAPAPLVGLVGRKEYEHCAQDIYFFLQSVVCLKQLTVELLELLLLSAFPELEEVIRQCHEEKDQFGILEE
ncbi:uncharacterized protein LOC110019841 isoform X2 [Phalaenopsis equestris]|uniref:uncharacterized protein LOC110019841 isoform X2 n=1 Tax=Phalaenopsis equestris TaxID=78828 RepID=UPI0009E22831|nr:uncharacterized protein LOC110019841 isoform X2 [Phalaenopsis equestris]